MIKFRGQQVGHPFFRTLQGLIHLTDTHQQTWYFVQMCCVHQINFVNNYNFQETLNCTDLLEDVTKPQV